MNRQELINQIRIKKSYLCVGLDTDLNKIPAHLHNTEDPIFEFNKAIIDATKDSCVAYKMNLAFYESLGYKGWISLEKTVNYIPQEIFKIADAKRGDIGNTSFMYAHAFFKTLDFDAITLSPYMGYDSISPFLEVDGKWAVLLALTSNEGSKDFQQLKLEGGKQLFEEVITTSSQWGSVNNIMYVVGATKAEALSRIRELIPEHFLLVPGVGSQGGSLQEVAKHGMNDRCGLLVNASRSIIYADVTNKFEDAARQEASRLQAQMELILQERELLQT